MNAAGHHTKDDTAVRQQGGGVIAGTPVWTEQGLVPVERLHAGDRILCGHAADGSELFEAIADIGPMDGQILRALRFCDIGDQDATYTVYCTDRTAVWSSDGQFRPLPLLEGGETQELAVRRDGAVIAVVPIWQTSRPGIGWEPEYGHSVVGWEFDFTNGASLVGSDNPIASCARTDLFAARVYALRLRGAGGYFAGELGLRVR